MYRMNEHTFEKLAVCVLFNPNLPALSMYILVVLLVSAALRTV